jgi:hypothetical protein
LICSGNLVGDSFVGMKAVISLQHTGNRLKKWELGVIKIFVCEHIKKSKRFISP